jgi:hypothetical protein
MGQIKLEDLIQELLDYFGMGDSTDSMATINVPEVADLGGQIPDELFALLIEIRQEYLNESN